MDLGLAGEAVRPNGMLARPEMSPRVAEGEAGRPGDPGDLMGPGCSRRTEVFYHLQKTLGFYGNLMGFMVS